MTDSTENLTTKKTSMTIGSSSSIDFPFWVLLQDGLRVPPFDKHTGGNQVLQSVGMSVESWYKWLKLILVRHDNRLCWHVPDINAKAQENVESFREMIGMASEIYNIDNTVYDQQYYEQQRQVYSQQLIEQEQGYQEALVDYQVLDIELVRRSEPPQLYQDNPQVMEILTSLWDDYRLVESNKFLESVLINGMMKEVLKNPPTDSHREVYLIDYPHEVEVVIPPIFCIVTVPNRPVNETQLEQRIFNIIQQSTTYH